MRQFDHPHDCSARRENFSAGFPPLARCPDMRAARNDSDFDVYMWVRLFLLFNLGPLPLAVLFGIGGVPHDWSGAIAATWGALIGLTAGILRASLLRCLAGVNVGA